MYYVYILLKLICYEAYISEKDARTREKFLKTGRGREVLDKQLADTKKIMVDVAHQ